MRKMQMVSSSTLRTRHLERGLNWSRVFLRITAKITTSSSQHRSRISWSKATPNMESLDKVELSKTLPQKLQLLMRCIQNLYNWETKTGLLKVVLNNLKIRTLVWHNRISQRISKSMSQQDLISRLMVMSWVLRQKTCNTVVITPNNPATQRERIVNSQSTWTSWTTITPTKQIPRGVKPR